MSLSDKSFSYNMDDTGKLLACEDVKEFIKDVKIKIVENDIFTADEIFRVIDEQAGEDLI